METLKKVGKVVLWVFAVLFFLSAIMFFTKSGPVSGILLIIAGVCLLPLDSLEDFFLRFKLNMALRIVIAVVLFIAAAIASPSNLKDDRSAEITNAPTSAPTSVAENTPTVEPTKAPTDTPTPTEDPASDEEKVIKNRIKDNYDNTDIKSITLNADLGTDNPDDLIALVYLKWNVKNSEDTSKQMLTMYSDDLAATVASDCPNIQEIAIFWEIPYLDKNVKFSYERKGNGMYVMDHVW